jgi:hypothetical protein
MSSNLIFQKTQAGRSEVEANQLELTQHQRRILILVNGKNDGAALSKMSLCKEADEILEFLLDKDLIELVQVSQSQAAMAPEKSQAPEKPQPAAAQPQKTAEEEIGAREFLCNTLKTYGNQVRITKLLQEINAVESVDNLKQLVNAWYREISESPSGMYDADNLKKRALQMLALEEASGLR